MKRNDSGFVLVALMIIATFILVLGLVTSQLALSNLQLATAEQYRINTQFAADAGLDAAIVELNNDSDWAGSGAEITLLTNSVLKSTYYTRVTDDADPYVKYLDVTAKVYVPASASTPRIVRNYQLKLRGVGGGSFSVVTGVGGLVMSNNSKIVGGNVYVNGKVTMDNSSQIGLTTNSVDVSAAHQSCPIPATNAYPTVCGAGNGEPITINSPNAKIYGTVKGTNQTTDTNMYNPGLVAGDPPPLALPTHDRDALKAAITSTVTGASAGCNKNTKTWAAHTKITGNVSVTGSCEVTVNGDIWITGDFSMANTAKLIVASGLTDQPVLMIDGSSGLTMRQSAQLKSNAALTGFRVVTYYSAAACSPDCSDVTGTNLYNSRNLTTIDLDNSAEGPQSEFYARWSRVTINNSGNLGALVGQTVELKNSSAIVFGASVTGVSAPQAWVVETYKRTF